MHLFFFFFFFFYETKYFERYVLSRVANLLLTKLARDRTGRISALGLLCTDLATLTVRAVKTSDRYSPRTALAHG